MSGIAGEAAIVTGAGRGIGRAVALSLARAGARVALLARTEEQIRAVREEMTRIDASGEGRHPLESPQAAAIACDVTDPSSVRSAVTAAEEAVGPAAILVNGAGEALSAPLRETDDVLWGRLLAVNLTGTFLMIRQVAPGMVERGRGRIINVASVAGLTGAAYVSAYTAAKHGVVGLTRALSQELARSGVTVNAVCPGYVDTDLTDRSVANIVERTGRSEAEARAILRGRSPQNRMMAPEEIAALVVYLASEEAQGINGQAIVVDGGGLVA